MAGTRANSQRRYIVYPKIKFLCYNVGAIQTGCIQFTQVRTGAQARGARQPGEFTSVNSQKHISLFLGFVFLAIFLLIFFDRKE